MGGSQPESIGKCAFLHSLVIIQLRTKVRVTDNVGSKLSKEKLKTLAMSSYPFNVGNDFKQVICTLKGRWNFNPNIGSVW